MNKERHNNEPSLLTTMRFLILLNTTLLELKPQSQRRQNFVVVNWKYVGNYSSNWQLPSLIHRTGLPLPSDQMFWTTKIAPWFCSRLHQLYRSPKKISKSNIFYEVFYTLGHLFIEYLVFAVWIRGLFRTIGHVYDGNFCENNFTKGSIINILQISRWILIK